jgi:hypothetical protein
MAHRARRAKGWIACLGIALIMAAILAPGTVTASRFAFQSPPPEEPTPLPTDTPLPLPTDTPVPPPPPESSATPIVPTEPPVEPPTLPPAESPIPAETPTSTPLPVVPTATLTVTLTPSAEPPRGTPLPVPTDTPEPSPEDSQEPPADEPGAAIINWVKFWDTMAVTIAYPWLCCGVGLLLLVPLVFLFLEIKGRRPPPRPPERLSVERRVDKE